MTSIGKAILIFFQGGARAPIAPRLSYVSLFHQETLLISY